METKDRTTRTITGMLAALAVLVVATSAGNVANAMSGEPETTYDNCREAWQGSPAFNTCSTDSIEVEDGQCKIRAICESNLANNQRYGTDWKGALENVWSLNNCNAKLTLSQC